MSKLLPSPLGGIRVLDLTRILAGPFCTMLLGDLGAEIWKIERPGKGDDTRTWKPPDVHGESCYFLSINRNKQSVALNMKHPKAQPLMYKLIEKADVLVENYKPGAMQRLGFDYDTLRKRSPSLIYCSVTGYGQTGPWSKRGGYDVIAEALGGLLHITGPRDGEPCKAGVAVVDMLTGLYAHGAIMAALLQREQTGRGQWIDCNLLSTQIATLINIGSNYLNAGIEGSRWGTAHESIVPYQAFRAADRRWFVVGAGSDAQFHELARLIRLPQLAEDARYWTNADRVKNREELLAVLSERFEQQPLSHWDRIFGESGNLPYGPVNDMAAAFRHPQVVHNNLVRTIGHPTAGQIKVTGPAVKFSDAMNDIRSPPPQLGQHTVDVLRDCLELDDQQIQALKKEAVIDFPVHDQHVSHD